jgi:hypothetical protein
MNNMQFRAYLKLLCYFWYLFSILTVWGQEGGPSQAPTVKSFALDPNQLGAAVNSANLFTGDLALPLNLVSLSGRNGLDVNVSIAYSNVGIEKIVNTWNLDAPAGVLGLGWSMDVPKIIVDHKQTVARDDDEYFLLEGGAFNPLVRTTSGSDAGGSFYYYATLNYQFWKIKFYYLSPWMNNGGRWEITKEDGTTYVYGDASNGRNTIQWVIGWNNWIGDSNLLTGQTRIASVWNLSEIKNVWGDKITFEYEQQEQAQGNGTGALKHTEASYLKRITDVYGRKVEFFYEDKVFVDPNNSTNYHYYYYEPHQEISEPDAYQEFYEKKYLHHINIVRETGSLLFSVNFTYSNVNADNNTRKMLLSDITQTNPSGLSLPPLHFDYYLTDPLKGYLQKVTYPAKGTVSYEYKTTLNEIGHSDRQKDITPGATGYAEPNVWTGGDYTVVAWRQNNNHSTAALPVRLYAYQWEGEWREKFITTIQNVQTDNSYKRFKDFQVITQKNFFAVLSKSNTINNLWDLYIVYKNPQRKGEWLNMVKIIDYGTGTPTLVAGENYVFVGSYLDDLVGGTYYVSKIFTYKGFNSVNESNPYHAWIETDLNQTNGDHFYTGTNNYFISHNRNRTEFNFHYLSEDKKWIIKTAMPTFPNNSNPSNWYASNGFALAMAGGYNEYVYTWDNSYTNFTRHDPLGALNDYGRIFMLNNNAIGYAYGNLAKFIRFNGSTWTGTGDINIASTRLDVAFGNDFIVWQNYQTSSPIPSYYKNYYVSNNNWTANYDISYTSTTGQTVGNISAGNNFFCLGNKIYFKYPDNLSFGTGTSTFYPPTGQYITSGAVTGINYFLYKVGTSSGATTGSAIQFVKNNTLFGSPIAFSGLFGGPYVNNLSPSYANTGLPQGYNTFLTFSTLGSFVSDVTQLKLNRVVDYAISGKQKDYPVQKITVNDGNQNTYTFFDYNFNTAAIDPNGAVAMYHEVKTIPGGQNASDITTGYTKTYFYNGLYRPSGSNNPEEQNLPLLTESRATPLGMPFKTEVYKLENSLLSVISTSTTMFDKFSKALLNDQGTQVNVATYIRPTEQVATIDGVKTYTWQVYDATTGLTKSQSQERFVTSVTPNTNDPVKDRTVVEYKYFWEVYDPTRERNILTPVIQTRQMQLSKNHPTIPNKYISASAITYKQVNGVFAPYKSYQWLRSGTGDFDFTNWSDTGEPTTDWKKVSQIDKYDSKGNVQQTTSF